MLVADPAQVADDLTRTGVYLGPGWALALVALVGVRLARRPWATRLLGAAGVLYLGCVEAAFGHSLDSGTASTRSEERSRSSATTPRSVRAEEPNRRDMPDRAGGPGESAPFSGSLPAGRVDVALEATTEWRFIVEELVAAGATAHLAEPAKVVRGRA